MTPEQDEAARQLALVFALFFGYLALVVMIVWPSHQCHDMTCPKNPKSPRNPRNQFLRKE